MNVFGRIADRGYRSGDWGSIKKSPKEIEEDPQRIDLWTK